MFVKNRLNNNLFKFFMIGSLFFPLTCVHAQINNLNVESGSEEPVLNAQTTGSAEDLFVLCTALQLDAARLACYDKVVSTGQSGLEPEKKSIDLVKTVENSIKEGSPNLVLSHSSETMQMSQADLFGQSHDNTRLADADTITATQAYQKIGVTPADVSRYSQLSLSYDLDSNSEAGLWTARPYHPMYVLPAFVSFDPNRTPSSPTQNVFKYSLNEYDPIELKAQISLKTKVGEDLFDSNADLWFGYTQQMYWQVYNEDNSRPFRATNYEPEIFLTQPVTATLPFNGKLRMLGVGAIHQSNGQSDPLSRSWNRLYLMGGAEWGRLSIVPKVWTHVTNDSSENPSDNPDITDYYGHGDIDVFYDFGHGESLEAIGRYNFSHNNGAIQLNYTLPFTKDMSGFIQLFHGYGESIIDYNYKSTTIGVGVSLRDWQSL